MHRAVLELEETDRRSVDHINHNGLDNRKSNLRACAHMENMANQKPHGGTSRFKGVYWHKDTCKWCASIRFAGKLRYLGRFYVEEDAASAYDAAAIRFFEEFACTNKALGLF